MRISSHLHYSVLHFVGRVCVVSRIAEFVRRSPGFEDGRKIAARTALAKKSGPRPGPARPFPNFSGVGPARASEENFHQNNANLRHFFAAASAAASSIMIGFLPTVRSFVRSSGVSSRPPQRPRVYIRTPMKMISCYTLFSVS